MQKEYLDRFIIEMKNRNYALNTLTVYSSKLEKFLKFAEKNKYSPEERIYKFLDTFTSDTAKRHAYSAIKLFYNIVLKKICPYMLTKVKKKKRVPYILTRDEVLRILKTIDKNMNHYLMVAFLYGSGLRINEVVNIKVRDVDLENSLLTIKDSKGHKDRITIISDKLIDKTRGILKEKKENDYLFKTISNNKYSKRTVQKIFSSALEKSKIKKRATCHTLRHSFASHLLQNGIDIRRIKKLLGHKSIKTTMIYLQINDFYTDRIQSPL